MNKIIMNIFESPQAKMMNLFNFLLLGITFFILSCDGAQDPVTDINECIENNLVLNQDDEAYITFQNNLAKWNCLNISHYSFVHIGRSFSGCIDAESLIEVKNNEIIKAEILIEGASSNLCNSVYKTIDEYLEKVREAVDSSVLIENPVILDALNGPLELAHKVGVEYNEEYGIPTSGSIDYIFGLADEEYNFKIKNFTVLD